MKHECSGATCLENDKHDITPAPWVQNGPGGLRAMTDQEYNLYRAAPYMLDVLKGIAWKLSHNFSKNGISSPGTIDRRDAYMKLAEEAIRRAEGK